MQYGCIGEQLSHSFSKEIHNALASYTYELREIPAHELDTFMRRREFAAINVTIPYKQAVIPYLYDIEDTARAIGAVNTVVNRGGRLYGYNTDFGGMTALIRRAGISLAGKKVLILGTGGTSMTAMAAAQALGAETVLRVSRRERADTVTYATVERIHRNADILINTTPRGMFSREPGMAIDPQHFPRLSGVIDAIYHPLRTEFVLRARQRGATAVGGLYMLVMQAVLAAEIFTGSHISAEKAAAVYRKIHLQKENIVLTGMPCSGKTTVGRHLAAALGRPFIDTDQLVVAADGRDISTIFREDGEAAFRDLETAAVRQAAAMTGAVIATGGGAVLRPENVDALRQNGTLFFLDRSLSALVPTDDRPLANSAQAVRDRYAERIDIYRATADRTMPDSGSPAAVAQDIERILSDEDLCD